jgi:hypothetical protein
VRTRWLLLVIHARTNGGDLMLGFSIMVLLMTRSTSSTMVAAFVMMVSKVIITCLSVHRCGFRMMGSMACFYFLYSTMVKGLLAVGWLRVLGTQSTQDRAGREGPGVELDACWLWAGLVLLVAIGFVPLAAAGYGAGVGELASCWCSFCSSLDVLATCFLSCTMWDWEAASLARKLASIQSI